MPAEDLLAEYIAVENLSTMLDLGFDVVTPDMDINDSNREEIRAEISAQRAAMDQAIESRGAADIAGRYKADATSACSKIQSMWAGGLREGYLGNPTLEQVGHRVTMTQFMQQNADVPMETQVVIVEDVFVFTDMMNSDFVFRGSVEDDVITVMPDADRVLAAWPDWVKAPSRKNLEKCKVTLTRE
jgi:hypothetical protein